MNHNINIKQVSQTGMKFDKKWRQIVYLIISRFL